jgi:type III secretion system HrpE/YscL family protein
MSKIIKKSDVRKEGMLIGKTPASNIPPMESGGVLNKKVLEAKDRAQTIIDEAVNEADRIRSEARAILEQISGEMERAKKDGYSNGREEGLAAVTEQLASLNSIKEKFYSSAEPEIIKLVMTIAEKIIGKMVRENEAAIKSIVRQAVESSLGERITVRLNPEDYKIVSSVEFEFRDVLDRTKRIVFKEDESIKQGGCVVETEVGTIDARLETQLKAIRKALEL